MSKKIRLLLLVLAGVFMLHIVGKIIITQLVENKIAALIRTHFPEHYTPQYHSLSYALMKDNLTLTEIQITIRNRDTSNFHTIITSEKIVIENFNYWKYLTASEIHIKDIKIENIKVTHHKSQFHPSKDTLNKPTNTTKNPIFIKSLKLDSGSLSIFDTTPDSSLIQAKNIHLNIADIRIDNNILSQNLPLEFESYNAGASEIFMKVSPFENCTISKFSIKDKTAALHQLRLATKYEKAEHSQLLEKERDHFDLNLEKLTVSEIDFDLNQTPSLITSKQFTLSSPILHLYRNKLVADDASFKPLYSKRLRMLPFNVTVDLILIEAGAIQYVEKVKAENPPGLISFSEIDAGIKNIYNLPEVTDTTQINIKALFMEATPFKAQWKFDPKNTNDAFTFASEIDTFQANQLNSFTESHLNISLQGQIDKTFFTIDGNNNEANINMKISYKDFKVAIMKDDKNEKKWVKSALVNIFISKDSKQDDSSFTEDTATVSRNLSTSFFNFLWLAVEAGLKNCIT